MRDRRAVHLLVWLVMVACLCNTGLAQSGRNRHNPKSNAEKSKTEPAQPETDTTTPPFTRSAGDDVDEGLSGETLKIDATLVTVPTVVSDRQGRYVPFLKTEDFTLFEDGVKQEITFLAAERVPFKVALVMDTSGSIESSMEDIQESAIRFIRQLKDEDEVMVVSFNSKVEVLNELTSDRDKIRHSIRITRAGGGTKLYEALYEAATRLRSVDGRKAIILLTDGEDTESRKINAGDATEAVVESGALFYAIQFPESISAYGGGGPVFGAPPTFPGSRPRGSNGPGGYPDATFLRELVKQTGGDIHFAGGRNGLPNIWRKIADELRHVYVLGYYPTNAIENGGYRQVKVQLRDRETGLIRHKEGYRAGKGAKRDKRERS